MYLWCSLLAVSCCFTCAISEPAAQLTPQNWVPLKRGDNLIKSASDGFDTIYNQVRSSGVNLYNKLGGQAGIGGNNPLLTSLRRPVAEVTEISNIPDHNIKRTTNYFSDVRSFRDLFTRPSTSTGISNNGLTNPLRELLQRGRDLIANRNNRADLTSSGDSGNPITDILKQGTRTFQDGVRSLTDLFRAGFNSLTRNLQSSTKGTNPISSFLEQGANTIRELVPPHVGNMISHGTKRMTNRIDFATRQWDTSMRGATNKVERLLNRVLPAGTGQSRT